MCQVLIDKWQYKNNKSYVKTRINNIYFVKILNLLKIKHVTLQCILSEWKTNESTEKYSIFKKVTLLLPNYNRRGIDEMINYYLR